MSFPMSKTLSKNDIEAAIKTILGDKPKSSLLFGAPAISVQHLASHLDRNLSDLPKDAVLLAAVAACSTMFKGKKQAQFKQLVRCGQEKAWIVFRPALDSGPRLTSIEPVVEEVIGLPPVRPPPRHGPQSLDSTKGQPHNEPSDHDGTLLQINQVKSAPFTSGERSDTNTAEPTAAPLFVLPPAHRIDAHNLGDLLVPDATVSASPRDILTPADVKLKMAANLPAPLVERPISTQELKRHFRLPPARTAARTAADLPAVSNLGFSMPKGALEACLPAGNTSERGDGPPLHIRHDSAEVEYLHSKPAERPRKKMIKTLRLEPELRGSQAATVPEIPDTEEITIILENETAKTSQSPSRTSPWPSASSVECGPVTPPLSASPLPSPTDSFPSTPWLVVAFHGLPFGPDMPGVRVQEWGRVRWQVMTAQLVVILGVAYIFYAVGVYG